MFVLAFNQPLLYETQFQSATPPTETIGAHKAKQRRQTESISSNASQACPYNPSVNKIGDIDLRFSTQIHCPAIVSPDHKDLSANPAHYSTITVPSCSSFFVLKQTIIREFVITCSSSFLVHGLSHPVPYAWPKWMVLQEDSMRAGPSAE
ncbi:hypothetical protein P692DRAFT_201809307 [Suillus brevipes Sb2]|nr:hypothetical protein P692DRAFT_201809307 [Suillus brevipes Sb2]